MPGAWVLQGFGMFSVVEKSSGRWLGQAGPWKPEGWPGNEIGWTFHRAGPNRSQTPRSVMTMIYMDRDMRLKAPENHMQQADRDSWCPGAKVGEVIDTPINPLLFDTDAA